MEIFVNPEQREWGALLKRPQQNMATIGERVASILNSVQSEGDAAILKYNEEFDGAKLDSIVVTTNEIKEAAAQISDELRHAIQTAASNIEKFHAAQLGDGVDMETMPGVRCVQHAVPIQRVGLYIPGGSAPLFSTVLMLAIPASIAGCKEIVLCTPPDKNGAIHPAILYAAAICGVTHIFKVGGAQAIAAMAYGTQSIDRVDKIFGPGNQYVTVAKQMVSFNVAIDMPAGPSEVLVMADDSASSAFVASDLLSQAEHGADSQVILLTTSRAFAELVKGDLIRQVAVLPRFDIATCSLDHCRMIVMDSVDDMVAFANAYAAEHLIISMENPWGVASNITAAGSVFIGNYTPESAGDYASGSNHTLPTYGWARSTSGVNIDSFMRKITYQEITPEGLKVIGPMIELMAATEGLEGHRNAVSLRLQSLEDK